MKVVFPHGTTSALAQEELKTHSSTLIARFGSEVTDVRQEWKENRLTFSFRARGAVVSGWLVVGEKDVKLEANLPLMAMFWEGQIRERVVEVMREIFMTPKIHGKEQHRR
ncbi:MAG: hypothetical protein HW388_790 [Dehalococcoidia bacterium]|nr:hypothetical protein [Dehalococcoidia bacterium]